ncbi:hypothetical protein Nhal_0276 [Nitrosococcus halophilus Nc 4]|uniref:Uncharacterized protein n=1 Tax=Nitrosococcus halophilus (strain Nc4) TaxID=472759 RepID=D5BUS6_NITHN|nr:hypothetical protein Nhal_0276 [Nitrosococcus halophilus Nc 4]
MTATSQRRSISKPPGWRGWPLERLERGRQQALSPREGVLNEESSWSDPTTLARQGGEKSDLVRVSIYSSSALRALVKRLATERLMTNDLFLDLKFALPVITGN